MPRDNHDPLIRTVTVEDAAAICEIYNVYVGDTIVSFEEQPVTVREMGERIREVSSDMPWLVLQVDGEIRGYAYAMEWRPRTAYRYSAESTIYMRPDSTGQGWGQLLYRQLIEALRSLGFHCVVGVIALPNEASVRLHEKLRFEQRGKLVQMGRKFDQWIDVGYWQLDLEPR